MSTWTNIEARREYQRRYRAAAKLFGRCRDCRMPIDGGTQCETHRGFGRAQGKRWWAKLTSEQKRERKRNAARAAVRGSAG